MKFYNNNHVLEFDTETEFLCSSCIKIGNKYEASLFKSPFLTIDSLPVKITSVNESSLNFVSSCIFGSLRFDFSDTEAISIEVTLHATEYKQVCLCMPIIPFKPTTETLYFNPDTGGSLKNVSTPFRSIYAAEASICATFAYENGEYGLGFGFLNGEQKRIVIENGPKHGMAVMSATFEILILQPDVEITLPTFYITAGKTWQNFLTPYKLWMNKTGILRNDTPHWVFHSPWHLHVILSQDTPWKTKEEIFEEIDRCCQFGEKKGFKPLFFFLDWWKSCEKIRGKWYFDHFQGDFLEARQLTKDAITYLKQKGAMCGVYVNITAIGEYSELFHRADDILVKDANGGYARNWHYPMFMTCPDNDAIHKHWDSIVDYLFAELGLDCLFLDQAGGGYGAPYCFNSAHRHDDPDCYGKGLLNLIARIKNRVRSIRPDAFVYGELAHDFRTEHLDCWLWHWSFSGLNKKNSFGDALIWMKYIRPDAVFIEFDCQTENEARALASRGVWINVWPSDNLLTSEKDKFLEYSWRAMLRDCSLLIGEPMALQTDCLDVSAVLFGAEVVQFKFILGFIQTYDINRIVQVWLPLKDGELVRINYWPEDDEKTMFESTYCLELGMGFKLQRKYSCFTVTCIGVINGKKN